jgi:hypothetical protein
MLCYKKMLLMTFGTTLVYITYTLPYLAVVPKILRSLSHDQYYGV